MEGPLHHPGWWWEHSLLLPSYYCDSLLAVIFLPENPAFLIAICALTCCYCLLVLVQTWKRKHASVFPTRTFSASSAMSKTAPAIIEIASNSQPKKQLRTWQRQDSEDAEETITNIVKSYMNEDDAKMLWRARPNSEPPWGPILSRLIGQIHNKLRISESGPRSSTSFSSEASERDNISHPAIQNSLNDEVAGATISDDEGVCVIDEGLNLSAQASVGSSASSGGDQVNCTEDVVESKQSAVLEINLTLDDPLQGISSLSGAQKDELRTSEQKSSGEIQHLINIEAGDAKNCLDLVGNVDENELEKPKSASWKLDKRPSLSSVSSASSLVGLVANVEIGEEATNMDFDVTPLLVQTNEFYQVPKRRRRARKNQGKQKVAASASPTPVRYFPSPPMMVAPPGLALRPPPGLEPQRRPLRADAPIFTPAFTSKPSPPLPPVPPSFLFQRADISTTGASVRSTRTISSDGELPFDPVESIRRLLTRRTTSMDDGHDADDELESYNDEERPSLDLSFLE